MKHFQSVSYKNVDITDGFWEAKQTLNREVTVFAVEDRYEETGRFEAFGCEWTKGSDLHKPHFFWDSDVAKWMEGAAYIIKKEPNEALESKLESIIDQIEKNQQEDGYFNIYHTVVQPQYRFKIRDHHELYCLGHLLEAAIAYCDATGKDRFLNLMEKYVDYVIRVFTIEKGTGFTTPGHEEIELALIKAYRFTGKEKYRDLAMFFLNSRGVVDETECSMDWMEMCYHQSHLPVREQKTAEGHAVRACYLYSGMADGADVTNDEALLDACNALFENITKKKMYITGGVGSSNRGEAFTIDYDLPNDTAYCETCASIALGLFGDRMKNTALDRRYADIVEREMYNGALAGLSLDGTSFFYENPLEINLSDRTRHVSVKEDDRLPITQRKKNFDCSCCPPNMTRYIANIGGSCFSCGENEIILHQFMNMNATILGADINVETNYPNSGEVTATVAGGKGKTFYVRIPGWCDQYAVSKKCKEENGYALFTVDEDVFTVNFNFEMKVKFMRANHNVRANVGKVAVMYGPLVYCMEKIDNNFDWFDVLLDTSKKPELTFDPLFNVNTITLDGTVSEKCDALYLDGNEKRKDVKIKLIPFFGFANRGESDMSVWLRNKD